MRGLRRSAIPVVFLVAAACGGAGPSPDRVLSAAGTATAEVATTVASTAPAATAAPATTTTTPAATSTTVRRTTTTVPRPATTRPPATLAPPKPGYAPAPPPPGVAPDGVSGYGGLTTTTEGSTSVSLRVYPREQYFGETMQIWVGVTHMEAVSTLTLDLGNGHVVTLQLGGYAPCARVPRDVGGSQWYVYPAPGTYRITATVTVTPCQILPGPPGGWALPDGSPAVDFPEPWLATGPAHTVSASMDILQRADVPPRPVGPPPGP